MIIISGKKKEHIFIDGDEYKECSRCKRVLPIKYFHKDNSKWDGLHGFCKDCKKKADHNAYKKDPDKKYEQVKAYKIKTGSYYESHPYNPKYYSSESSRLKKRARDMKRRVLKQQADNEHKISDEVIKQVIEKYSGKCAYCGCECLDNYHIDHKNPLSKGGGNEFDNLALSCPHCNLSKHNKTDIEFCGMRV